MPVPGQMEPCGVLIVNKHSGVTSHDIVGKVRKLFGTRRVGHTGTLDPMATGVLVVLVGRAAKASEYLVSDRKRYRALLRLGLTTDSEDTTGQVLSRSDDIPSSEKVAEVCHKFLGEIKQVPPMYSALKVGGQKLCDLARRGETVERQARDITIYSLNCVPSETKTDYILDISCSSGTYIRTLCADIGKALGCGGVMAELLRTETGGFSLSQSHTIQELEEITEKERLDQLIPVESLFTTLPKVVFPEFFDRLFRSGCEIYQKKIGTAFEVGQRLRVCRSDGSFYALAEVAQYEEGTAIKSLKFFDIQ